MPLRVPPKVLKDKKTLTEYVHKHVFPIVNAETRFYLSQFFTVLFSDGFETGDFSAWTGTSGSPAVVSSWAHHGVYSAEVQANDLIQKSFGTSYNTVYMRSYVKFNTLPDADYYSMRLGLYVIGDDYWYFGTYCGVYVDPSDHSAKFFLDAHDIGGGYTYLSSPLPQTGVVYCLEVRHTANGAIEFYIDGELKAQSTIDNYSSFGAVVVASQGEMLVDCVVVSDAYIGPESEAALKTVTDALALSDDACRNKNFVIADTSGLTDAVLQHKTLVANDSVDVNDAVLTDKTVVTADAVNLAGSLIVDKVLQVTETTNLFETVQVGVGGVKKTKLFLIIGDLAVQLTGE
jgi:hypothetical protein